MKDAHDSLYPETIAKSHLGFFLVWQLIGCVLLFGSPFMFIAHWGHHIALISGILGTIMCTVTWALDGMEKPRFMR